jgi:flagellin-like protein
MISYKKGLSEVVTTLIIVLLVLVAIGIVWVVVNNLLQGGSEVVEINNKCMKLDIRVSAAKCTDGDCIVTYKRHDTEGDAIAVIKIILSNGATSQDAVNVSGDITALALNTETIAEILTPDPNKVEIVAYFVDSAGNEQLCPTPTQFDI